MYGDLQTALWGLLFPCLIGRIGVIDDGLLEAWVNDVFPCLIGRIGVAYQGFRFEN